jgi:hypothetical protein
MHTCAEELFQFSPLDYWLSVHAVEISFLLPNLGEAGGGNLESIYYTTLVIINITSLKRQGAVHIKR